ncbi:hypothetical protein C7A07_07885 [Pseudomonas fragi]|nr:hypothetical protein [Pseudomonas fragi]PRW98953.1 hypothetical protein C7A07_07885 [Pseudomonas fragi]
MCFVAAAEGCDKDLSVNIIQLWERACSRLHHRGVRDSPRRQHREQARSHRFTLRRPSARTTSCRPALVGCRWQQPARRP